MIGVYMNWNPKQQPNMFYDANTHDHRRNNDMIIQMLPSAETSQLDGTVAYDESKT